MATITEVTGKSYKILADATAGIWHKISMWTKASDVYNNSNKTLEKTCGSITGITSSLTSTSTTMAASASAIKQLNDKIADLNSNLSNPTVLLNTVAKATSTNANIEETITISKSGTLIVYLFGFCAGNYEAQETSCTINDTSLTALNLHDDNYVDCAVYTSKVSNGDVVKVVAKALSKYNDLWKCSSAMVLLV